MSKICDINTCCCPTSELIISHVDANNLHVQVDFGGPCSPGGLSLDDTIRTPTGFATTVLFLGFPILVTLSQNNCIIELNNPLFPECSEIATRNTAISTTTINLVFISILAGLMTLKLFMM